MLSETETVVGTSQYPWKLRNHTVLRRDLLKALHSCQNRVVSTGRACHGQTSASWVNNSIRLHTLKRDIFLLRSLLSKKFQIISSHRNDALLDKNFVSRWLRLVGFSHSPRISFFLSLQRQSRASPTLSRARHPLAFRLVSQICFGRFVRGLGEEPPSAPLVRSSRRPLLQNQMRGHHQQPLRQGALSP